MLAYVFWHRPAPGVRREDYERSLGRFHRALAAHPTPGFIRSATRRFANVPWLGAGGAAYEDWYLVESWTALGDLESGAVGGARREPHDEIALASAEGAGAVYGLVAGASAGVDGAVRSWFERPEGMTYRDLERRLGGEALGGGAALWRRRLVLGPAPEHCVAGPTTVPLPTAVDRLEAEGEAIATD